MDLFLRLKREHSRLRALANLILQTRQGSAERTALFEEFHELLGNHIDAEERLLFAHLMYIPGAQPVARKGIEGHCRVIERLEQLRQLEPAEGGWLERFDTLQDELEYQSCEEEELLYPVARLFLENEEEQQPRLARGFLPGAPFHGYPAAPGAAVHAHG